MNDDIGYYDLQSVKDDLATNTLQFALQVPDLPLPGSASSQGILLWTFEKSLVIFPTKISDLNMTLLGWRAISDANCW